MLRRALPLVLDHTRSARRNSRLPRTSASNLPHIESLLFWLLPHRSRHESLGATEDKPASRAWLLLFHTEQREPPQKKRDLRSYAPIRGARSLRPPRQPGRLPKQWRA